MAELTRHSYAGLLSKVIAVLERRNKPFHAVEWGPGRNSDIILASKLCVSLLSIEGQLEWYKHYEYLENDDRVDLRFIPIPIKYDKDCKYVVTPTGEDMLYDLMFVDGQAYRIECLALARRILKPDGFAMLHDWPTPYDSIDGPGDAPGSRGYNIAVDKFKFKYLDKASKTSVVSDTFNVSASIKG